MSTSLAASVKPSLLALIFLLALSVPGWPSKDEAGSGIVYGPGHAYKIGAPSGWIFDNESARSQGIHAVLYPVGESWAKSKVVIYTGATPKGEGGFQQVLTEDEAKFRAKHPNLAISDETSLTTRDGRTAVVRKFTGDSFGNSELVAYIDTPEVVCQVVLSARDNAGFEKGMRAFPHVVSSFKFLAVDSKSYIESGKWRDEVAPYRRDGF